MIGLTLRATGLYFFFAGFFAEVAIDVKLGIASEDRGWVAGGSSSGEAVFILGERGFGATLGTLGGANDEIRGERKTNVTLVLSKWETEGA
jgi:hypothetical protein